MPDAWMVATVLVQVALVGVVVYGAVVIVRDALNGEWSDE